MPDDSPVESRAGGKFAGALSSGSSRYSCLRNPFSTATEFCAINGRFWMGARQAHWPEKVLAEEHERDRDILT
jgi:hypothetical protein